MLNLLEIRELKIKIELDGNFVLTTRLKETHTAAWILKYSRLLKKQWCTIQVMYTFTVKIENGIFSYHAFPRYLHNIGKLIVNLLHE